MERRGTAATGGVAVVTGGASGIGRKRPGPSLAGAAK